jgi:hypothetical protein
MHSFLHLIQSYERLTGSLPTKTSNPSTETHSGTSPTPWNRAGFEADLRHSLREGRFWADEIKNLRSEPAKRLTMALNNLPLPAAFREGAVAVRALIRDSRRSGKLPSEPLAVLYDLAAIESFLFAVPYVPEAREPAFNVIGFLQPEQWQRILRFEYETLGYDQLALLNKTDCAWLKEVWGVPEGHTTLRALHEAEWREAVQRLLKSRWEDSNKLLRDLGKPLRSFEEYLDLQHKTWEKFDRERQGSGRV